MRGKSTLAVDLMILWRRMVPSQARWRFWRRFSWMLWDRPEFENDARNDRRLH